MSKNNPAKNIYLQAKRASKIFDIPLSKSKTLIARVVYQCHDFPDLIKKFDANSFKASVYPYCLIGPHSTLEQKVFFEKNINDLCERFSKNLIKPFSQFVLLKAVKFIFGLDARTVSLDIQHRFDFNDWQVYPHIDGNTHSVYFNDFKVNDVTYRILAINEVFNDLAQPKNESQKDFNSLISSLLLLMRRVNIQPELIPVKIGGNHYFVFGYPLNEAEFTKSNTHFYVTKEHVTNNRSVFAIGDVMICLDLFEHDKNGTCVSEYIEYFSEFSAVLENFKDRSTENIVIDAKLYRAYFRPCSGFEFERFFSSALIIRNIYS